MGEGKYPDIIELKLKLRFPRLINSTKMRRIEITNEVLVRLMEGKCVEGSLRIDGETGRMVFRAYNRQVRKRVRNRLICQLEHGWLMESAERYKFYCSVRKDIGAFKVDTIMRRELNEAMNALTFEYLFQ